MRRRMRKLSLSLVFVWTIGLVSSLSRWWRFVVEERRKLRCCFQSALDHRLRQCAEQAAIIL